MAWRSSGATNKDLIENLWRNKLITDPRVKAAFLKVNPPHTQYPTPITPI
jgi:protein-L-isoaspartate(D-aspartate) O-methyltransferase